MEIAESVCIVTGASSGIGEATACYLARLGAHVVLAARRTERLRSLARELPGSLAVPTDVTAPEQIDRLLDLTMETYGRVDVLVNNAGQGLHVPIEQLDPADLRLVCDLNVIAPLMTMKAVLPAMRAQGRGAIVNISSATSLRVIPGLGGYAATKSALNMLSQTARIELAGAGIAVSVVYPRLTATEFHQRLRAGRHGGDTRHMEAHPPELVAKTIAWAVETGEAHVLVDDPPRPLTPGDPHSGGGLLAR